MCHLIRLKASGSADLIRERLDFRLEPKVVATLKGQVDTENLSGVMIPVVVTETFPTPEFRPDLQGMLKQVIEKRLPDLQKKIKASESSKDGSKKNGGPDQGNSQNVWELRIGIEIAFNINQMESSTSFLIPTSF